MKPLYRAGWIFFRVVSKLYFRSRAFNPERVPPNGPCVLAANHASFLDPPLVGSAIGRPIHYLAREDLFDHPVFGSVLRGVNAIPVDREGGGAAGLRRVLERLEADQAVLLFPEGTRSRTGQLQSARSGLGLIALKTGAPVVPVRIFGSFEAYGRHLKIPRPRRIRIKFGKPLAFETERAEAAGCSKARLKELYQEVADSILNAIAHLEPWAEKESFP